MLIISHCYPRHDFDTCILRKCEWFLTHGLCALSMSCRGGFNFVNRISWSYSKLSRAILLFCGQIQCVCVWHLSLYIGQVRCKQTTRTRIICAYFVHTHMWIRTHMRIYMHVYVSLLCIPRVFLIWSIVGQTGHFWMDEKAPDFNMKFAYCEKCQWKLWFFEFSIVLQIHRQTTIYWHLLDL